MSDHLILASALIRTLDRKLNVLTASEEVMTDMDDLINQLALATSDRDNDKMRHICAKIFTIVQHIDHDLQVIKSYTDEFANLMY